MNKFTEIDFVLFPHKPHPNVNESSDVSKEEISKLPAGKRRTD